MPLYDYLCNQCGSFREWASMSRSSEAVACPECGGESGRMVTAPFLADMNPLNRIAHQRNEKSAHEPRFVSRKSSGHDHDHSDGGRSHTHSHGHSGGHHGHAHGASRPWMIGH